ncbi:MAG: DUF479 domain-containing protein [Bacteroidia bacterium]|nr:DUF479 domain-containing protein [Bacteroidia bacterium]
MNYLAHALLSNNNTELLIGNFIADHLRGNDFGNYSQGIVEGIYLHRRIDTFTDAHPLFKASKRIFYKGFEKHSGILVDIYFDHLLAKNFQNFHHQALPQFAEVVYGAYSSHQHLLPQSSSRFLDYVLKNNIYSAYATAQGIEQVLFHLSQRIKHQVRLDESLKLFTEAESELQNNFSVFFSEAQVEFSI